MLCLTLRTKVQRILSLVSSNTTPALSWRVLSDFINFYHRESSKHLYLDFQLINSVSIWYFELQKEVILPSTSLLFFFFPRCAFGLRHGRWGRMRLSACGHPKLGKRFTWTSALSCSPMPPSFLDTRLSSWGFSMDRVWMESMKSYSDTHEVGNERNLLYKKFCHNWLKVGFEFS